jgi:hypothetical protein
MLRPLEVWPQPSHSGYVSTPASASLTTFTGGSTDNKGPQYKKRGRYRVLPHRARIRLQDRMHC